MEFEYWWLLAFPLFFLLGWLAARIDIRHVISQSRQLPESYFKGLNFLLNQQPDKAIEAFTEAAKADTETVELHFTLGGLFRRRGEVDRAIQLHQSLVERPDLGQEQRLAAQMELGQDYLKAGLLDRAEHLFRELEKTRYAEAARRALMEIFVQEKEWRKAIAAAEQLASQSSHPYSIEVSQFHCELAAIEAVDGKLGAAQEELEAALKANRRNVRASMLAGDFEAGQRRWENAIQYWKRIEAQNPAYLSLVAEKFLAAYRALGRMADGAALLNSYLVNYPSIDLFNAAFQAVLEAHGTEPAYRLGRDELRRNPTLQGLEKMLEAQMFEVSADARQDVQLIKDLVRQHSQRLAYFQCDSCGFKARQFFWRCPACGGWETFPPKRLEERQASQTVPKPGSDSHS
jgi:lipopolysaccharide biosynthesis regulator YciM